MVSDGSQDLCELSGPVVQVQRAYTRKVSPQISVDTRALNADQRTQVETGPSRICRDQEKRGDPTPTESERSLTPGGKRHTRTHSVLHSRHTDCCPWRYGWPAGPPPHSGCSSEPANKNSVCTLTFTYKRYLFICLILTMDTHDIFNVFSQSYWQIFPHLDCSNQNILDVTTRRCTGSYSNTMVVPPSQIIVAADVATSFTVKQIIIMNFKYCE